MQTGKKDEALQPPVTHAEAPRSATASVKSKNGFYWLFTMREVTGQELIKDIENFETMVMLKGWTPVEPRQGGGFQKQAKPIDYVEGRMCPQCGSRLVHAETKEGKKFIKCSTNKWDFAAKQSTGCKYVDWGDMSKPQQAYQQQVGNGNIPERDINDY